jgi:hypothetical protein
MVDILLLLDKESVVALSNGYVTVAIHAHETLFAVLGDRPLLCHAFPSTIA